MIALRAAIRGCGAAPVAVGVVLIVVLAGAGLPADIALWLGVLAAVAVAGGMFRRW